MPPIGGFLLSQEVGSKCAALQEVNKHKQDDHGERYILCLWRERDECKDPINYCRDNQEPKY